MKLRDNLNTEIRYKELIQKKTSFVEEDLHEYQCTGTTWDSKQELSHFDIILRNANQILISKYSAGYPVLELIPDYLQGVQFMKKGWNADAGYVTMLWYLSIGVMLECHKELQQLSILLRELSVKDKLFSFLVNNTQDYASEKLLWTTPYAGLIEVIELAKTNKEKAV